MFIEPMKSFCWSITASLACRRASDEPYSLTEADCGATRAAISWTATPIFSIAWRYFA